MALISRSRYSGFHIAVKLTSIAPFAASGNWQEALITKGNRVLILGAGVTGLGAGLRLSQSGCCDAGIVERCSIQGGMAATIIKDGFVLDYGVHGLFVSKKGNEEITDYLEELLEGQLVATDKKTAIYFNKKYISYPLRMKELFSTFSPLQSVRCFFDFLVIRIKRRLGFKFQDRSFKDWISARFGRSLYDLYFGPYTEKVWGIPADTLDAAPLVRRVTTVSLWDVIKKAAREAFGLSVEKKEEYSQQPVKFLYGKQGTQSITGTLEDLIRRNNTDILFRHEARKIILNGGSVEAVEVFNGSTDHIHECDHVISTIPITDLLTSLDPEPPPEILAAAGKLRYRALIFVFLMIDRPSVYDVQWVYYSDSDIIFNRVNEFRNLYEGLAPPGKTALCAEITCFCGDGTWNASDGELHDITVRDLEKLGLLNPGDILGYEVRRLPSVYPLYDLETIESKEKIVEYIEGIKNLHSIGRLGSFEYLNMDEAIGEGFRVADGIIKEIN